MFTMAQSLALVSLFLAFFNTTEAEAQTTRLGILHHQAPSWEVSEWLQLPQGKASLDINDFKGKVLYLYCFQAWCPGCHSHGFPTLQRLTKHYANDLEVAFVAIQTTFEGYGINTFHKAEETAQRYNLKIPVGHSGAREALSPVMRNYRTGGTPWTIIIDKRGMVRFNNFHIQAEDAVEIIDALKSS